MLALPAAESQMESWLFMKDEFSAAKESAGSQERLENTA
jgi:hypothetical protein